MTTPQQRAGELLATYSDPKACVADLLCDRHPADTVAFTIVEPDMSPHHLTFGELRERSRQAAAALADLGVEPGDRVATLMGKSADLVIALLGIWRRGAVHVPLFTAFAPPAISFRLTSSAAKVVVADADQRKKLLPGENMPDPAPWRIVVAGGLAATAGDAVLAELLASYQPDDRRAEAVAAGGDGELIRLFTSGTTGSPKGVPIPVRAIAAFLVYFEYGLGVQQDDVFWNAADPGWAYGLFYGITAPMAAGHGSLLLHAGFSPELTYQVLSAFKVTNFAAAPTVFRVLRSHSAPCPPTWRCAAARRPANRSTPRWCPGPSASWVSRCTTRTGKPSWACASSTAGTRTSRARSRPDRWGSPCPAGRPRCCTTTATRSRPQAPWAGSPST